MSVTNARVVGIGRTIAVGNADLGSAGALISGDWYRAMVKRLIENARRMGHSGVWLSIEEIEAVMNEPRTGTPANVTRCSKDAA